MAVDYNPSETNVNVAQSKPRTPESNDLSWRHASSANLRKVGHLPCLLLFLSILGSLAFVGYINFLWFAADGNLFWKSIALAGWTTRSIAIAAVVLRTSITVQTGIASSMLASILFEDSGIRLPKIAVFSIMRAAAPTPYSLFWHTRSATFTKNWLFSSLAATLSMTSMVLQFTSTILLADVDTGYVTGKLAPYHITIRNSGIMTYSKWNVGVRQYPTFAEYSEGIVANGSYGLSDTGNTMRALLPITSEGNRSSVHMYKGFSMVFDTRVVCLRPNVTDLRMTLLGKLPVLHGNMAIPSDLQQIAAASRVYGNDMNRFSCQISQNIGKTNEHYQYHPLDWKLTVCQFRTGAGVLQHAFLADNFTQSDAWLSHSYLLINITDDSRGFGAIVENGSYIYRMFNDSIPGLVRESRSDWVDVYRTGGNFTFSELKKTKLSLSLCFSAFQARPYNISASSPVPLVEPRYTFDTRSGRVQFDEVRRQMLTSLDRPFEDRGILSLDSQNWSTPMYLGSFVYPYFDPMDVVCSLSNSITQLVEYTIEKSRPADISIGGLLLEILRMGGTTAEGVQSMLISVVESRYADYVFSEDKDTEIREKHEKESLSRALDRSQIAFWNPFDEKILRSSFMTQRADFVAVQIPGGQGQPARRAAGATQPYVLVMSTLLVHSIIVCIIVTWFLKSTTITLLWESWSNIAQVIMPSTTDYLEKASCLKDSEVKALMQSDNLHVTPVTIGTLAGGSGELNPNLLRLRTQRAAFRRNESEQGLMLDDLESSRPSTAPTDATSTETLHSSRSLSTHVGQSPHAEATSTDTIHSSRRISIRAGESTQAESRAS